MLKKKNEVGRSMVEMLGVLSVMGVLSVAGIEGYSSAMRSYRTNEIINGATMLYTMGISANVGKGAEQLDYTAVIGSLPRGCNGMRYVTPGRVWIAFQDEAECKQVATKIGEHFDNYNPCGQSAVHFGGGVTYSGYLLEVVYKNIGVTETPQEGGVCSKTGDVKCVSDDSECEIGEVCGRYFICRHDGHWESVDDCEKCEDGTLALRGFCDIGLIH